ncbi:MAG: CotH kinase family protein [Clostridia bacterium]|nr:CotH kinase family protein [Clostridia bacterium]
MKRIKITLAVLLSAATMFAVGCETAAPPDTETLTGIVTEPATETEPVEEDTRLSVDFSVKGGVYQSAQTLELSLPENAPEGAYVAYTTDCSEPGPKSKKYESAITVCDGENSVVRAACFGDDGAYLGYIKTATYICAEQGRFSTYIVSLVTEKDNLYGKTGIIDHPTNSGKEWERPCHVEIFTSDGVRVVSQDSGIRIFGGSSRGLRQKSFRLIARKDGYFDEMKYNGKGSFEYPFFDGRQIISGEGAGTLMTKYDRLVLRNGGNDSIQATAADPERMTLTRDATANAFMAETAPEVAYQLSAFAVVYLNGEYYGILDMKEDINDDYMKNVYGLDKNFVTVIKSELDTTRHCAEHDNGGQCRFDDVWFYYEVDEGEDSELGEYIAMCEKARAALSGDKAALDAAYAELSEKLDTENFMKYCAVSLYTCNTDWPHNNLRLWRYTGEKIEGNVYSDGKWRFTTRDMDFTFGRYQCLVLPEIYTLADTDTIRFTLGNFYNGGYDPEENYPDSLYVQSLLALCLHNDGFRQSFLDFCEYLCSAETENRLESLIDLYADQIKNEIKYHTEKWSGTISGKYNATVWKKNVKDMKKWAQKRPDAFSSMLDQIKTYFK